MAELARTFPAEKDSLAILHRLEPVCGSERILSGLQKGIVARGIQNGIGIFFPIGNDFSSRSKGFNLDVECIPFWNRQGNGGADASFRETAPSAIAASPDQL